MALKAEATLIRAVPRPQFDPRFDPDRGEHPGAYPGAPLWEPGEGDVLFPDGSTTPNRDDDEA
jgi:hypothetical protein